MAKITVSFARTTKPARSVKAAKEMACQKAMFLQTTATVAVDGIEIGFAEYATDGIGYLWIDTAPCKPGCSCDSCYDAAH